jgi:hypothetical protein
VHRNCIWQDFYSAHIKERFHNLCAVPRKELAQLLELYEYLKIFFPEVKLRHQMKKP